jgi:hypothetical protein
VSKRFWSWVFLAAAAALLLASGWFAGHPFTVLTQWKTTEGSLLQSALIRDHDSDGVLTFRIRATFRYSAGGKEQNAESVSYFESSRVAVMQRILTAYNTQSRHVLRYNPAKPEEFEFGAGFNTLYLRTPLQFLAGACGCILMFVLLWRLSQPPPLCRNCGQALRSQYRYCPECGESISAA